MLIAAKPTLFYLKKLGIWKFLSIKEKIEEEKQYLTMELEKLQKR